MITEQDLKEAIAECQGQRNPNASTCLKLAAFLTIQKELYGDKKESPLPEVRSVPSYSFAPAEDAQIGNFGDSDFLKAIEGCSQDSVWKIMDELMSSMAVIQPRIYDQVMRRIRDSK